MSRDALEGLPNNDGKDNPPAAAQADTLREWVEVTETALRGGRLSLEMTGRLMEFDAEGNMTVRYSEAMVVLLR